MIEAAEASFVCQDWRDAPGALVESLYAAQADRWSTMLEWDSARRWSTLESGRVQGTVRGHIVRDRDNAVSGWSAYAVQDRMVHVGQFVSPTESVTRCMLDAIFTGSLLGAVDRISFFAFADAPGLAPALRALGLDVDRYWYLARDVTRGAPLSPLRDARPWRADDLGATADLLMRAYDSPEAARPFAPSGDRQEWLDYTARLTMGEGCGPVVPRCSFAIPFGPGRLAAVALTSRISPQAAHLTQLAVDPQWRRQGLGALLLAAVLAAADREGFGRMTLLVAGRNRGARRLYESSRFEPAVTFVAGGSCQPRRSTSVAPGGSVVTFR